MRVGVVQMPVDPWDVTVKRAQELERMGFDHLWVYDHLTWRHYRDRQWHATIPWLTGVAANTARIRLGTMVATPNLRHPVMLAKETMSLDHVSGGRFILGLGTGASGFDAAAFGDAPLTPSQRASRFEEYVDLVDGLLRFTITSHKGEWYTADEARVIPGCVQTPRVPLAIACGGPRVTRLAAAFADTWITMGDPSNQGVSIQEHMTVLTRQMETLVTSCERIERDPDELAKLLFVSCDNPGPMGSLETFTDVAGAAAELGFTDIVIHDHRTDDPALDFEETLITDIAALGTANR